MSVLIVMHWIGRMFLILLAIILALLLLVLLVPVRYKGQFSIIDPVSHETAEWDRVLHSAEGRFLASWMGPLLRLRIEWQDSLRMDLQILFIHKDPRTLIRTNQPEEHSESDAQEQQPSPGDRIRSLYRKIDYYRRVLRKEDTGYTIEKCKRILLRTLHRILPRRWQLEGDVGLGDPEATARVLEIQGMLIPFTAGHVCIRPEFMQYRMNGRGDCKGRIRLIHLVIPVLQAAMDRRVMRTIRRMRNADRNIERHYRQSAANGG